MDVSGMGKLFTREQARAFLKELNPKDGDAIADALRDGDNLTFLLSKSLIKSKVRYGYRGDKCMSEVEITRMSSKGQVVIPQDIREEMGLKEGEAFAVTGGGDTLLLKKIERPSKEKMLEDWERITEKARKEVKKLGIKQSDVSKLIHAGRGIKE